jgi:hypothetical protein
MDSSQWLYLFGDPAYYGGLGIMEAYLSEVVVPVTTETKDCIKPN